MTGTIEIVGTGGIIEGNLGAANVNVNLDDVLNFDGTDDKIDTNLNLNTALTSGDQTYMCWFKLDAIPPSTSNSLMSGYVGGDGGRWDWFVTNGGVLRFQQHDKGDGAQYLLDKSGIVADAWFHAAVVHDTSANTTTMYVNGVQAATQASVTNDLTPNVDLAIGARIDGSLPFDGYLADVKVYDAALTVAQIQIAAAKINQDTTLIGAGTPDGWYKLTNNSTSNSGGAGGTPSVTGTTRQYDEFSVDVYDNSTTTDGTFTVTKGKVEGLALTSVDFEDTQDYGRIAFASTITQSHDNMSIACWVKKENATGNDDTILGKSDLPHHHYLKIGTNGKIIYKQYPQTLDTSGDPLNDTNWHHIVVTLNGDSNGAIYLDGVAQTLGNNSVIADGTFDQIGLRGDSGDGEGTANEMDGKIRDVRFYDYALSAEQAASLYSGTYPPTPKHHYKLDEGSGGNGDTVADTGTGTTNNGTLGPAGHAPNWSNGTLDLDRGLEIAANGVMSAPRGTLKISLDTGTYVVRNISTVALPNNGSDAAVTGFAHNDGTVELGLGSYGHNQQIGNNASHSITFYNLDVLDSWYDTRGTVYVENVLDLTSYRLRLGVGSDAATYIIGKASATSQSSESKAAGLNTGGYITGGGGFSLGSSAVSSTIQGASTIYPAIFNLDGSGGNNFAFGVATGQTAYQPTNSSYPLQLSNLELSDAWTTVDVGVPLYYKLTGDMKFAAVTLADEINLDLNGQRAEFGGNFSLTGTLSDTASGAFAYFKGTYTRTGGHPDLTNTVTTFVAEGGGVSDYYNPVPRRFFVNTTSTITFNNPLNEASAGSSDYILGAGTVNANNQNINGKNQILIATGGTHQAGSSTIKCKEDFTTSGGLIGKSALDLTGSEEVTGTDNLDEVATSNRVTVEAWFKATTDANYRAIFSRGTSWSTGNIYMYMNSAGNVQFSMNDLGATVTSTTSGLADGKWHHAAATYDQTNLKLYIDGKLEASSAHNNTLNTQTNGFKIGDRNGDNWIGQIGRVSIWDAALTEAQIREMLFYDFATADSEATIPDANCIGWWQFDEGTGTAVADSSTNNADGTLNSAAWAGAGTFTYGTSTVDMTGNGTWTYQGDFSFYNFKVAAASKTTTYKRLSSGTINIANNLYIGAGSFTRASSVTWRLGYDGATSSRVNTGAGSILSGATDPIDFSSSYVAYFNDEAGTFNSNVKIEYLITSYPLTLTNSLEGTGYLWASNNLFDIADQTCTTPQMRMNDSASAKINIDSGTLNLTSTSSGAGFRPNFPSNTFTAGPGATVIGPAGKAFFESQNNFVIVGKAENLNVTNEELSVTGQVINCTGDIIQQFPTIDHDQQLDYDTADDRDIILGRDLDKNTELINS